MVIIILLLCPKQLRNKLRKFSSEDPISRYVNEEGFRINIYYIGWRGVIHTVTLYNLRPSTKYYYKVGNGHDWSIDYWFTTAPSVGTPGVRIATVADMGVRIHNSRIVFHAKKLFWM